jgi:hypothetical protein
MLLATAKVSPEPDVVFVHVTAVGGLAPDWPTKAPPNPIEGTVMAADRNCGSG